MVREWDRARISAAARVRDRDRVPAEARMRAGALVPPQAQVPVVRTPVRESQAHAPDDHQSRRCAIPWPLFLIHVPQVASRQT